MTEPYRNADTRLKAAFAALRAEIETTFNVKLTDEPYQALDNEPLNVLDWLEAHERDLLDYAKQPASEG
jgi:hypothetical protein